VFGWGMAGAGLMATGAPHQQTAPNAGCSATSSRGMARTSVTASTDGRPTGISMVRASASKAGSALGGTNTTDTHMHTPAIAGGQGPATDGGGHRPRE